MVLELTKKQQLFLEAGAGEVLFGGAAGGGKSHAQLADAFVYALRHAGSRQLMLRRSFPELEKSLVRGSLSLYPPAVYRYNAGRHTGVFCNGSVLDFGYCEGEKDAYRYQSAEYDVIRFDELTHFTEEVYLFLMSRLRGVNSFPKQMKSTTNPGGVGHTWVKRRFVDPAPAGRVFVPGEGGGAAWADEAGAAAGGATMAQGTETMGRESAHTGEAWPGPAWKGQPGRKAECERGAAKPGPGGEPRPGGKADDGASGAEGESAAAPAEDEEQRLRSAVRSRVFLPAKVQDNCFLMRSDPGYVQRLEALPPRQRQALLHGEWNLFEGQFFAEFDAAAHVVKPFAVPKHWKIYRALDYGLDMLCCLWIAVDEQHRGVVLREVYRSDLVISQAAEAILDAQPPGERAYLTLAPPDLWSRRQETGRSAADLFLEAGVPLTQTSNARKAGWLAVKEWLLPRPDEQGGLRPRLQIFEGCRNLIRTLPALGTDAHDPNDAATEPHELTHAPDALRAFCVWWTTPSEAVAEDKRQWLEDD